MGVAVMLQYDETNSTRIDRNFRNQNKKIAIFIGEKNGYGKNDLQEQQEYKNRYSNKFKCPKCGNYPLEIQYVLDWNYNFVSKTYYCNKCMEFWVKENCDIKWEKKEVGN